MFEKNATESSRHYVITHKDRASPEWVGHLEDHSHADGWAEQCLLSFVRDKGSWLAEYSLHVEDPSEPTTGFRLQAYHHAKDPALFPWCVFWTPGESAVAWYTSVPYCRYLTKEDALRWTKRECFEGKTPMFTLVYSTAHKLKGSEVLEKAHPLTNDL